MNYLNYLLKAKGRHGTHSPFVYAWVEQALHEPRNPVEYPAIPALQQSLDRTLYRVLSFLNYDQCYLDKALAARLHWVEEIIEGCCCWEYSAVAAAVGERRLYILSPAHIQSFLERNEGKHHLLTILIWHPGNAARQDIEAYFRDERFHCTLFTWHFSLLIADPAFKRKQHYILR